MPMNSKVCNQKLYHCVIVLETYIVILQKIGNNLQWIVEPFYVLLV